MGEINEFEMFSCPERYLVGYSLFDLNCDGFIDSKEIKKMPFETFIPSALSFNRNHRNYCYVLIQSTS
jgi:hypothetical protein